MAKIKKTTKPPVKDSQSSSKPKYPYTTTTPSLRKLLQLIPMKPKPARLSGPVAKTWGVSDNSATTAIGVLRELGLVDAAGVPTDKYVLFMGTNSGASLAEQVRQRYNALFNQHEAPQNASNDELKRFFNIHSGGAEKTISLQIQTFKVLTEFCRFDAPITNAKAVVGASDGSGGEHRDTTNIHFDLHIHLPEGKSQSDYEVIIRAISEHIVQKLRA